MKKIVSLFLSLMLVSSLVACGNTAPVESVSQESDLTAIQLESVAGYSSNSIESSMSNVSNAPDTGKVLIAYFSLFGNADYTEGVDAIASASIVMDGTERYGTTEYLANLIQKEVGGDVHLIETVEQYPSDYDEVISQNHDEMDKEILPPLKSSSLDMSQYDTVFIGYPTWAATAPQAISSFLSAYDLSGKTVIPFCTHAGYGAGRSYSDIGTICAKSTVLDGLAVEAKDVVNSAEAVQTWLGELGMAKISAPATEKTDETAIKITIGTHTLDGVLYQSDEAQQFIPMLPLTVSMGGFGGREYYGGLDGKIDAKQEGQLNFENGQITYCPSNNSVAIFYAQTERPNLTMKVIPMGIVTSDLAVFDTLGSQIDVTFTLAD